MRCSPVNVTVASRSASSATEMNCVRGTSRSCDTSEKRNWHRSAVTNASHETQQSTVSCIHEAPSIASGTMVPRAQNNAVQSTQQTRIPRSSPLLLPPPPLQRRRWRIAIPVHARGHKRRSDRQCVCRTIYEVVQSLLSSATCT